MFFLFKNFPQNSELYTSKYFRVQSLFGLQAKSNLNIVHIGNNLIKFTCLYSEINDVIYHFISGCKRFSFHYQSHIWYLYAVFRDSTNFENMAVVL